MTVKAGGPRYAVHGATRKRDEEGGGEGGARGEGDVNMANGWLVMVFGFLVWVCIAAVTGTNFVWAWRSTWGF